MDLSRIASIQKSVLAWEGSLAAVKGSNNKTTFVNLLQELKIVLYSCYQNGLVDLPSQQKIEQLRTQLDRMYAEARLLANW